MDRRTAPARSFLHRKVARSCEYPSHRTGANGMPSLLALGYRCAASVLSRNIAGFTSCTRRAHHAGRQHRASRVADWPCVGARDLRRLFLLIGLFTRGPWRLCCPARWRLPTSSATRRRDSGVLNTGTDAVIFCFLWLYISSAGPGSWAMDALWNQRRATTRRDGDRSL
jgi:hypothetical protein